MRIQASYVANLIEYASCIGVSAEVLLNQLNDKEKDLCNPSETVTREEYLSVLDALIRISQDTDFGIHYGGYLNLKALGFVVEISKNASRLEQAVFILQKYLTETFPLVELVTEKKKKKYFISLVSSVKDINLKRQILNFVFCFVHRELQILLPLNGTYEAEMPSGQINLMRELLNVEVVDGVKHQFVFDEAILNIEINKGRVKDFENLLPQFMILLESGFEDSKIFSSNVRRVILNMCRPELPTFDRVAALFPMSNRTFQRKLMVEGRSFRKICDDIKYELSEYLSSGDIMQTKEIAAILGYSDASAYLHFLKKRKTHK